MDLQTTYKANSTVKVTSSSGDKHIAVLYGGMSAEKNISFMSGTAVGKALVDLKHRVTMVDVGADIAEVIQKIKPDIVYNALHGTYGEDGCIPGLLNMLHIPYTHAGILGSAISFNKVISRDIFITHNIKYAKSAIIKKEQNITADPISRPYIIKPINQGSSVGIEAIFIEDEFNFKDYKFPYGDTILVEEFIKGRELQVAVLNGKSLGIMELTMLKKRFYDYETKYTEGYAKHTMPAQIPDNVYNKAMEISEKACHLLHAEKGICRVEFIYSEEQGLYILEVNTHPGMTSLSICPEIAAYKGINFNDLVAKIVDGASYES